MFGFGKKKKKSKADAAIAVMDDAIQFASEKWTYFCSALPFKAEVGLAHRIASFLVPLSQGLRNNFEPLNDAPDPLLFLIAAKGVERSGTHTTKEIEEALGMQLPRGY